MHANGIRRLIFTSAIGKYRASERLALHGIQTISRPDVAHFILAQIDDTKYVQKAVLLSH